MGEEFEAAGAICGDNYWWNNNNSSARSMFPVMMGSTCSVAANNDAVAAAGNNYTYSTWQTDFMDLKQAATTRSCSSAVAAEDDSNNINNFASLPNFLDAHSNSNSISIKVPQQSEESAADGSILTDSTLHMMAFALSSSPSSNWNNNQHHSLLFGGRAENKFECVVEEERGGSIDSCNKSSASACSVEDDLKAMMKQQELFGIDEQSMRSTSTSTSTSTRGLSSSSSASYAAAYPPPCSTLPSLFTNPSSNYGTIWCTNQHQQHLTSNNGFHFSNNTTPFWNASSPHALHHIPPTLFPSSSSSQPQYQSSTFDDKSNSPTAPLNNNKLKREESPEKTSSSTANKSGSEAAAFKRPRIETPSPLPTFKVRKEKLGDRITALQQLVSPFGKTDTASVLHEAIEYIKFLHDQVNVLSTPYMKNGTPIPHQQGGCENMKESSSLSEEGGKQELRRRGLCLVPISSTFPMATETTADFWTPTFGGGPLIGGRQ